jgi:broad specificity phosphatase PhoE
MQLYFVRHGESEANARQVFSNSDRDTAYVVTPAIAEYDVGELEGKSDAASWQRYYAVRQAWFRDKEWTARIEGGESFEDIFDLAVEHGLGHTSVVIAEQRAHGLVCVHWDAADPPGLS